MPVKSFSNLYIAISTSWSSTQTIPWIVNYNSKLVVVFFLLSIQSKQEEFVATVQEQGEEQAKPANIKKK